MQFVVGLEHEIYKLDNRYSLEKTRNNLQTALKNLDRLKISQQEAKIRKYLQICELNLKYLHRYDEISKLLKNKDIILAYNHCYNTIQEIESLPNRYEIYTWNFQQYEIC